MSRYLFASAAAGLFAAAVGVAAQEPKPSPTPARAPSAQEQKALRDSVAAGSAHHFRVSRRARSHQLFSQPSFLWLMPLGCLMD